MATTAPTTAVDERLRQTPWIRRVMARPELGAVAGTVLVFIFFAFVAGGSGMFTALGVINFLEVSAQLGIIAVAAAMLMIGGEFDLSIGSMIGAAGVIIAIPAVQWGWPLWSCVLLAFAIACLVGYINGLIVIRSGLPSFIVTLAGLFILRGLTIGFTRLITGRTQVSGLRDAIEADWLAPLFTGDVGYGLFKCAATLYACIQVLDQGSADVLRGVLKEFEAIIAAVIGGTLLTGGYGSVIGASFGALIFGTVRQGIFYTGVNTDWFQVFLGCMLLIAVIFNNYVRRKVTEAR